jgi:hypothetical protein
MLKALTPVATLAIGCAFGHERPTPRLMAAVGLIAAGVMGASHGEGRFSGIGVAIMVCSVGAEALRLNVMQVGQLLAANRRLAVAWSRPGRLGPGWVGLGWPERARNRGEGERALTCSNTRAPSPEARPFANRRNPPQNRPATAP